MLNDPHITVATLVEKEGRFLMVEERSNGAIVFNQPAGHVEEGESLVEAALRETLEESGWQVRLSGFLGSYVLTIPDKGRTYYRFCFIAEAGRQVSQHLDTDIIAAHWLSHEEVLARTDQLRSPLVLQCIEDYRAGKRYPLDIIKEFQGQDA